MGIIYGLSSAIFSAIGYTLINRSAKSFPSSIAFVFDAIFGFIILVPVSLMLGLNFGEVYKVLPFAFLSAILSEAFVFFVLSKGEISITGTVFATYPIYTTLFAVLLLGERMPLFYWIMIAVVILGTILVSLPEKFDKKEIKNKLYVLWPLAGAIAVGISDTISKGTIDHFSMASFIFSLAFCQILVAFVYLRLEKVNLKSIFGLLDDFNKYKVPLGAGVCNALGLTFLWFTFDSTLVSIASPLTGSYPVLMVLLAFLFLKERPRKTEWIGIFLAVAGVIGVGLHI